MTVQPGTCLSAHSLVLEIEAVLNAFDGESSLKRLFWELLSYDRIREPLPISILPAAMASLAISLEVFAASEALTIVYAFMTKTPDGTQLEQMCWSVKRHIPSCAILLNVASTWTLVYPDESTKPRIRLLPLPGEAQRRAETARALDAMDAADTTSGDALQVFDVAKM